MNRLLANALRLYANRPRPRTDPTAYDELAKGLLSLSIGLALRERIHTLPGPRCGCEVDPPRGLTIDMPNAATIHASGLLLIRDRNGDAELATEAFRLSAVCIHGAWKMTRVLMTPVSREIWEAAV